MNKRKKSVASDLCAFLDQCPTSWHCMEVISRMLKQAGFIFLDEREKWSLKKGEKYFTIRNGSSLCAFIVPNHSIQSMCVLGAHSDSPSFKLKPNALYLKENMVMIRSEVYGAPLLSSWLNKDLMIAGRVFLRKDTGSIEERLVQLKDRLLTIPQLAIHLDRQANDSLVLNKQEHFGALFSLRQENEELHEDLLKKIIDLPQEEELLSHDLLLVPIEDSREIGLHREFVASYRLDNLASVHAILEALISSVDLNTSTIRIAMVWDNEEIGSNTSQGAASPFFEHVIERLMLAYGLGREEYLRILTRSFAVSLDMAHAAHPNYLDKHDTNHLPLLGKGIVLKFNAQHRYATDAYTASKIIDLCNREKIPLQKFVSRNDIACGSTIGPIHATLTGIPTVDIGCAELSMHSSREIMASEDQKSMCNLLKALWR